MRLKITKSAVKTIQETAQMTGRRCYVYDVELRGFGFSATPKGAVSYFVEYRCPSKRRLTIGRHGVLKPLEARDKARALLGQVANGVDVARKPKGGRTFGEVFEAYISQKTECKTIREMRRLVACDACPVWRNRPISDIGREDVIGLTDKVRERSPSTARALFEVLRPFWAWALERNYITLNPMLNLTAPPKVKARARVLTDDELRAVWLAANEIGFPFGPIIQLLALTSARRSEVAGMHRREIDGDIWTLPPERTKNGREHQIDLHPDAVAILDALPPTHNLIFSTNGQRPPVGFGHMKRRLDAAAAVTDWRIHDLRRTVASGMAGMGILPDVIERHLNHQSGAAGGLRAVYNRHTYRNERRAASLAWGDYVARLVRGGE